MPEVRVSLETEPGARYATFRFGGTGGDAPQALLSLRASGSMKFLWSEANGNRDSFFRSIGVAPGSVLETELIHSTRITFACCREDVSGAMGDGLATANKTLFPSVTVADCMPIWFYDMNSSAFGVLHSGWQGTGISRVLLAELSSRFGTKASDVSFILGPCIGHCCYKGTPEKAATFMQAFGIKAASMADTIWRLDLKAANLRALEKEGVEHITVVEGCTACRDDLGSYRREGAASYTRMVAMTGFFGNI